jgi:hypothetical protein
MKSFDCCYIVWFFFEELMDDEIKESYESCVQKLFIFCAKFGTHTNTECYYANSNLV